MASFRTYGRNSTANGRRTEIWDWGERLETRPPRRWGHFLVAEALIVALIAALTDRKMKARIADLGGTGARL